MAWSPEAYDFWADNPDSPGYRDRSLLIEDDAEREVIVLDDDDDDDDDPVQAQPEYDETSCKNGVLLVFPDICPNYLSELTLQHGCAPATIISAILDRQEKGENYPTQAALESRSRKRKRASERSGPGHDLENDGDDDDDECDPERVRSIKLQMATHEHKLHKDSPRYINLAKKLLGQDFPKVPQLTIRGFLLDNGNSIFEAYTAMDEKRRTWDDANPPWAEKKTLTKILNGFTRDHLPNLDLGTFEADEQAAIAEYMAAKELSAVKDNKAQAEVEEHKNFLRAQAEGQTTDCGICFEEFPLNRMVQCEGEDMHWFCRGCLRSQAESQIGMAKYELTCMSLEGCSAGFSKAQRALFLDKKLTIALDRIEQEAVLRMAGIENLETCPFCPYAAEYPPVETDKEFRCDNPRCQLVSCRLCRKETHIPKTCAEADADRGLDARHILEEAMSAALIRRCNKCQNPFVKQDGCNKIRCTKCGTLQCDVCRKTIADYSHFNDTRRGGKNGQCPLFDENEGRYEKEVSNAEAEMRKKVVEENPDVDEEALCIPMLGNTRQDEHKLQKDPIFHQQAPQPRPFLAEWDNARHEVVDRHLLRAGGPPFHFPQNGLRLQHPFNGAGNNNPIVPAPLPHL
ncbi:putative ring finger protein [Rosellinia necatrix]|uniref:Putative ring finger protein n=1 Tax=Rosellinia necatrix TaxID=77044 RepID=A0A1W2TUL8_ROSNE|nr:putative ring finger protein [Rosellinia necatrix]